MIKFKNRIHLESMYQDRTYSEWSYLLKQISYISSQDSRIKDCIDLSASLSMMSLHHSSISIIIHAFFEGGCLLSISILVSFAL